jgi:Tfp pilus assembly protein PilV
MNRVGRKARQGGFSIAEAIVGAGVIAAGILALISLFPVSSDNLVASAGTTTAVNLGTQKIEELKNLIFPPAAGNDTKTVESIPYTRTWTVALAGTAPNRNATITVTVTWPGRLGTLSFNTIVAE